MAGSDPDAEFMAMLARARAKGPAAQVRESMEFFRNEMIAAFKATPDEAREFAEAAYTQGWMDALTFWGANNSRWPDGTPFKTTLRDK
jgi:hypothetical protein